MRPTMEFDDVILFLGVLPTGDETLLGYSSEDGLPQPMVAADEARYQMLLPIARALCDAGGWVVRVVRFKKQEVREVLIPDPLRRNPDTKAIIQNLPEEARADLEKVLKAGKA